MIVSNVLNISFPYSRVCFECGSPFNSVPFFHYWLGGMGYGISLHSGCCNYMGHGLIDEIQRIASTDGEPAEKLKDE